MYPNLFNLDYRSLVIPVLSQNIFRMVKNKYFKGTGVKMSSNPFLERGLSNSVGRYRRFVLTVSLYILHT